MTQTHGQNFLKNPKNTSLFLLHLEVIHQLGVRLYLALFILADKPVLTGMYLNLNQTNKQNIHTVKKALWSRFWAC